MKKFNDLLTSFVVVFICIALPAGTCLAEDGVKGSIAKKMLAAVEANDYNAFMAQKNQTFKSAIAKDVFQQISTVQATRMKQGYEFIYLGTFNREGREIYFWKLVYKKGGDDTLITLSFEKGEVAGFWMK